MCDKIVEICEICDDHNGERIVNSLLKKGWSLISACQVGTLDSMDIVYVVGATQDVVDAESKERTSTSLLSETLNKS